MSFAVIGLAEIFAAWKWGDWRNWKKYYSTILYLMIADKVYDFLVSTKPMWIYGNQLGDYPFFDVMVAVLLYPATVILFFSFLPKKETFLRICGYFLLCVAIYTIMEWVAVMTGGFVYLNGWNLLKSAIFNLFLFPMLYLHQKKPLLVWPISGVCAFAFLFLLNVPLHR